ncbi:hypothetical protein [Peribacillus simplex]
MILLIIGSVVLGALLD